MLEEKRLILCLGIRLVGFAEVYEALCSIGLTCPVNLQLVGNVVGPLVDYEKPIVVLSEFRGLVHSQPSGNTCTGNNLTIAMALHCTRRSKYKTSIIACWRRRVTNSHAAHVGGVG